MWTHGIPFPRLRLCNSSCEEGVYTTFQENQAPPVLHITTTLISSCCGCPPWQNRPTREKGAVAQRSGRNPRLAYHGIRRASHDALSSADWGSAASRHEGGAGLREAGTVSPRREPGETVDMAGEQLPGSGLANPGERRGDKLVCCASLGRCGGTKPGRGCAGGLVVCGILQYTVGLAWVS